MISKYLKIAKYFIAAKQSKKLLQYLKNDYKGQLTQEKVIELLKKKIQQIQQKSFNFVWFTNNFINKNKHYQDINVLLNLMQSYKNLNKQLKTFQFNKNTSFGDLYDFMNKFKSHQIKSKKFDPPQVCQQILRKGNYIFYYADANNKECFKDLHKCNMIDPNGKWEDQNNQYAKWCVVIGSVPWGTYTTSKFSFYVYVTTLDNQPIMLFNFGYTWDAQIKDIHDDPFTNYDQDLIEGIKQLAQKYDFKIQENTDDFDTFNKVDKLYCKQLDINNIDQKIINESQKYNGLNFIEENLIYDFKKNQKAYLIANDNIVNLKGYKINVDLLNLLQDNKYKEPIIKLAKNEKFINNCSNQIFDFIINFATQYKSLHQKFYNLIKNDKIKDEKKVNSIIKLFIYKKYFDQLYYSVSQNKIKDENNVKQIIQAFMDNKVFDNLNHLIEKDKIKDEDKVKQIIQLFVDNQQFGCLYNLIHYDKIKDEDKVKQIIQLLINEKFWQLSGLVFYDKIKDENQLKQIIQLLIGGRRFNSLYNLICFDSIKDEDEVKKVIQVLLDNKRFDQLCDLIKEDKIKDEEQFKKAIQVLIDNDKLNKISFLIQNNKIKDEDKVKQIVQKMIDNKRFDQLCDLILEDKIKDENKVNQIIQKTIDNKIFSYLSFLITDDKIKDENKVNQIIQDMIDNKQFDLLSYLIHYDKIKDENKVNQLIQDMIDNKSFDNLSYLIHYEKITDPELLKKIEEEKNNVNIKTSSISRKLFDISRILKR